jgi:hypothetical protein
MALAFEHLGRQDKEDLLVLSAKILATFVGPINLDPNSKEFYKKIIDGAHSIAPFFYAELEE